MSRINAPAYCSTKPAAPPIPQAPSRSPTPAESAQDLEALAAFFEADLGLDAEEGFLLGDAGVDFQRRNQQFDASSFSDTPLIARSLSLSLYLSLCDRSSVSLVGSSALLHTHREEGD